MTKPVAPKKATCPKKPKNHEIIQVELSDLDQAITLLAQNPGLEIDSLPKDGDLYKAYDKVKLSVTLLYDVDQYPAILDLIKKHPVPANMKPGTLAAFVFGCHLGGYGDMKEKFCSPMCIQNIPPSKKKEPIKCCSYQVWTWDAAKGLRKHVEVSHPKSIIAYVFVDGAFYGFGPADVAKFKHEGVAKVKVYETQQNQHKLLVDLSEVDRLPAYAGPLAPAQPLPPVGTGGTGFGPRFFEGMGGGGSFLMLLLIVAILFLVYMWWSNRPAAEY